ncbi:hypothetical protein DFH08DRAFT_811424 [Mycena albidolilacea]|uniref:Uncharacterized protein n=1 Tax=Mycena albidolilacea TaxID=1033008 RepID=A0AAD6ZV99_9AGAR|nr:hypothetical protein DFH08DRAFT_811424 [Mycena albidolilacea]
MGVRKKRWVHIFEKGAEKDRYNGLEPRISAELKGKRLGTSRCYWPGSYRWGWGWKSERALVWLALNFLVALLEKKMPQTLRADKRAAVIVILNLGLNQLSNWSPTTNVEIKIEEPQMRERQTMLINALCGIFWDHIIEWGS